MLDPPLNPMDMDATVLEQDDTPDFYTTLNCARDVRDKLNHCIAISDIRRLGKI